MVTWIPQEGTELRRLYDSLSRTGALPHFLSESQFVEWVTARLAEMKESPAFASAQFVSAVRELKDAALSRLANEVWWLLVWNALRAQLKRNCIFKALHTPLQIIPKSLHPNGLVA